MDIGLQGIYFARYFNELLNVFKLNHRQNQT